MTGRPASTTSADHTDTPMMVVFHDALRRDLTRLARATARRSVEDPERHRAVATGWTLFKTQLTIHHTGEDDALWPRMRAHLADRPDELALLQAMEDEHAEINPLVRAVDDAFADPVGHERLADTVDALTAALLGHLSHEEREVVPLMDAFLTEDDMRAFHHDQRRQIGVRGFVHVLPWVLDDAPAERVAEVLHSLPAPVRLVYRRLWQPRYARRRHWGDALRSGFGGRFDENEQSIEHSEE